MKGFDLGGGQEEIDKWNNSEFCHDDWQVKIFGNIPADRISSLTVGDMTDITLRYASDLCGQWDKKYPENLT
ncbi:MAG: hypothetical protein COA79_20410 [Planctomycetota bacterium]|nr:MAG: hypothetical protein COA79_20410 [Planctomycetota bacterium]